MWKRGCGTFYLDWNVDTDPHKTLTSLSDTLLVLVGFDVLFINIIKIHIKKYLDSVPCWMKFKLNLLCDRECNAIFKFNPVSSEKLEEISLDVHCHIFKMTLSELVQVILVHMIWQVIYMKVLGGILREIFREVERSQHWRPDLTMTFMASSRSSGRSSSSKNELRNIFKIQMRVCINWISGWIDIAVDFQRYPVTKLFFCLCGFMVLDYVPSQLSAIGLLSCNSQLSSPPPPLPPCLESEKRRKKYEIHPCTVFTIYSLIDKYVGRFSWVISRNCRSANWDSWVIHSCNQGIQRSDLVSS